MPLPVRALVGATLVFATAHVLAADVDLKQPVPHVASRTPKPFTDLPNSRTVTLTNWQSAVSPGDVVGQLSYGVFCGNEQPLRYVKQVSDFVQTRLTRAFVDRSIELGLAHPASEKSAFDVESSAGGTDFRIGATLLAMDYRICTKSDDIKGEAYVKVKWEVYSTRRQKVVWSSTSEGSFATSGTMPEKDFDTHTMRAVVDNVLSDPGFVEIIRSDGMSAGSDAPALPALKIGTGASVAGNVNQNGTKLLQAVVTVQSGAGSGSGFYVAQEGYLLTNYHVVADAKFVKIKLANGHSLVGEVVRQDKVRDVALIRTDPVAEGVLTLRRDEPGVGEEVYALGSPFGDVLSGTLTRGVLSSRRVLEGTAFLQSDVAINPGNSGGPLLDATGRVVGIAQLTLSGAQGINMFIPIGEALEKLNLSVQPAP